MLQVNQKVKVIDNKCGHQFKIGSVIRVIEIYQVDDTGLVTSFEGECLDRGRWYLSESEVEKIENS